MKRCHLGLDPGVNGAIAVITPCGDLVVEKLNELTQSDLIGVLWDIKHEWPDSVAYVENVLRAMSKGRRACMMLGYSYGMLTTALLGCRLKYEPVTPVTWQRGVGYPGKGKRTHSAHKMALRTIAERLYPTEKHTVQTADAVLIAEYCRRTWS